MSLHGLSDVTIGVPDTGMVEDFYVAFGLQRAGAGQFATSDGGAQLRLVERPFRQLVAATVAAEDPDDVGRIRALAATSGVLAATTGDADADNSSLAVVDPISGATFVVAVRPRIVQPDRCPPAMNGPGHVARSGERAPAIFLTEPTPPRRLGHLLMGTPDLDASVRFFTDVLGFRVSDSVPGLICFLRCSTDHHNVGLMQAPIAFLHHTSWQVDDLDAIGRGAQHLLADDPGRSIWGPGRHFLGSNLFWYFRDPAGNFAEYYADLDQITDDDVWMARTWEPDKSLYAWGPPVPHEFVEPPDLAALAEAIGARV